MVKPQTTLVESLDLYHSLDQFDSARRETMRSIVIETFLVDVCYESHEPAYAYNRDQRFRDGQSLIGVIAGTAHKVTVQLPSERNDEISACAKDDVVPSDGQSGSMLTKGGLTARFKGVTGIEIAIS